MRCAQTAKPRDYVPGTAGSRSTWQRIRPGWNGNSTNLNGHDSVGTTAKRRAITGSPNFDCGSKEIKRDVESADRNDRSRQGEFHSLS